MLLKWLGMDSSWVGRASFSVSRNEFLNVQKILFDLQSQHHINHSGMLMGESPFCGSSDLPMTKILPVNNIK